MAGFGHRRGLGDQFPVGAAILARPHLTHGSTEVEGETTWPADHAHCLDIAAYWRRQAFPQLLPAVPAIGAAHDTRPRRLLRPGTGMTTGAGHVQHVIVRR